MAYSIPASSIASFTAGTLAGEIASDICEQNNTDFLTKSIVVATAHWTASSATGYTVNVMGLDPVGTVWTLVQSPAIAIGHGVARGIIKFAYRNLKDA